MEKKQYFWMNLIMTSRRDVTGMMVNGFGGIIPIAGRMITAIFRFMNYHNSARYLKLFFLKIYGDRYPHTH
jgi:hypothetical protein